MPKVDLIVIALIAPIMVGVYQSEELVETHHSHEQSSEALPKLFEKILEKYEINRVVYTRGPGSFMAIKVSYVFLKTLSIVKGIDLLATNSFTFNKNQPIKAFGQFYFIQSNGTITTKKFEDAPVADFELPKKFELSKYKEETAPLYVLPAV